MPSLIQPSFARGEISPALFGRVDTSAYRVALKTARNFIIHSYGGGSNRAGLQYIGPVKTHTIAPRMIPFRFKTTDTYMLEFGNLYMRVIREDAHVTETAVNISGATAANPVVVTTSSSHGYSNGDEVFIASVGGMTELNNRRFIVANVTATTFELTNQFDGGATNVDGTGYTAYTSGGTTAKIYEIVTTYATADLMELKFTQSADVITITHPNYPVREVSRTDHNAWTISDASFQPDQSYPTGISVATVGTAQTTTYAYQVTAEGVDTLEESIPGHSTNTSTPESATAASPVVVTDTGHPFLNGDTIMITGFNEMTEVNGRLFRVANKATNTYELTDPNSGANEDGTGYAAETTGGTATAVFATIATGNATLDGTNYNTISWTAVAGAARYKVYRFLNGLYGLIGETAETTFDDQDSTTDPDFDFTPPQTKNPLRGTGNYPAAVGYYEQRRVFGGSDNTPDTSEYTQAGNQNNLNVHNPSRSSDAITATLSASEINAIRHYVALNDLIILTSGEEWRVNSGQADIFSGATIRQKRQTSWGSSHRRPVVIGATALYAQDDDRTIRTIGYSLQVDGYSGSDISVLAPHIFEDHTLVDWAWARSPDSLIYMIRSDGKAATLTFNEEQEVVAFTRWDTPDASFERVAVIRPSTTELDDAGYFVVRRTINGNTVRLIEKTHPRRFADDVRDAFFVDSGLSVDSPITITGATAADPVVITATAHGLTDGDAVDIYDISWATNFDTFDNETNPAHLHATRFLVNDATANTFSLAEKKSERYINDITQANPAVVTTTENHGLADGDKIVLNGVNGMTEVNNNTYTVANKTNTTFELSGINSLAFTAYTSAGTAHHCTDGSGFNAYVSSGEAYAVSSAVTGLWHLEGESVVALADGNVVKSLTVTDGAIDLGFDAGRVHIGLRYIADFETLDIEDFSSGQGTVIGLKKHVPSVTLKLYRSRGAWIGPHNGDLTEMRFREDENMDEPTRLFSGDKEQIMPPEWNSHGRVFIRQRDPLPLTILAVVPFVEMEQDE